MPVKTACLLAAVAAISLFSGLHAARADTLLFTITGTQSATFVLDSIATPNDTSVFDRITFFNVDGTFNGSPKTFADITFFDGIHNSGGVDLYTLSPSPTIYVSLQSGLGVYSFAPPPLFVTGTFAYTNETLVISEFSAVPGPIVGAGLSGLILGFAGLGFMAYRRCNNNEMLRAA